MSQIGRGNNQKRCEACNDSGVMFNGEGPLCELMPCAYCDKDDLPILHLGSVTKESMEAISKMIEVAIEHARKKF